MCSGCNVMPVDSVDTPVGSRNQRNIKNTYIIMWRRHQKYTYVNISSHVSAFTNSGST